jgi:hypothetical protein
MPSQNFEYHSTRSCSSSSDCEAERPRPLARKNDFKFPEGGWECSKCQNYNFKGRKECHRCKKIKNDEDSDGMPAHMQMSQNEKEVLKKQELECKTKACAKKPSTERVGDWTCQKCFNHNFAFRDVCNMCYMSHIESNKLLYTQ